MRRGAHDARGSPGRESTSCRRSRSTPQSRACREAVEPELIAAADTAGRDEPAGDAADVRTRSRAGRASSTRWGWWPTASRRLHGGVDEVKRAAQTSRRRVAVGTGPKEEKRVTTLEGAADAPPWWWLRRAGYGEIEESRGQIERCYRGRNEPPRRTWSRGVDRAGRGGHVVRGQGRRGRRPALDARRARTLQGLGKRAPRAASRPTPGPQRTPRSTQGARAQLDALGQAATTLEGAVGSLWPREAGEAPARGAGGRVRELEAELAKVSGRRARLPQDDVATAAEQVATVRELCEKLHRTLAEEMTRKGSAEAYDEWEGHVDELEGVHRDQGLRGVAPARDRRGRVRRPGMGHAQHAASGRLSSWRACWSRSSGAGHARERVGPDAGRGGGRRTLRDLERARQSAATAVALDEARQVPASYSFMEA